MADQDASWLIGSATPSFSMSFSPASNPPSLDTRNLIWGMSVHIRSPDSTSPFSLGFAQCFSTCLI